MCDDQRHSAMSCVDTPTADAVSTPCLDALASRGVRFRAAYHAAGLSGAICSPSRAMLHTGCGPFDIPRGMVEHGLGASFDGSPDVKPLGRLLRDHGYVTHFAGKWHNDLPSLEQSFDRADPLFHGGMDDHFQLPVQTYDGATYSPIRRTMGVHATDRFADAGCRFLRAYADGRYGERPFCLVVAFTAPHDPRRTHEQWHRRYPADGVEPPPNFLPRHPFEQLRANGRDELLTPLPRDADQTRREIADYYAMIEHVDHAIGQLHDVLDQLGLADSTLVAHTADHGLAVGQHGLMGKQNLYDHSTRVPLLLAGHGVPTAQVREALVYQHDLYPTLLEAAGIEPPDRCAFHSLWPLVQDADASSRESVGGWFLKSQRMIRVDDRKLIAYATPRETVYQQYDLADDPWEIEGTVRHASETDPSLRQALKDWQRTMGDPLPLS